MGNEYIKNSVFEETIAQFKLAEKNKKARFQEFQQAEAELTGLFYLLAENIIRAFKFQLIDRDDALQEGVMICFQKLDCFKPELGRAFNYYTTCVLNHYRQLYRTAKSYNEFKKRYHEHLVHRVEEMFMSGKAKPVFRKKPNSVEES